MNIHLERESVEYLKHDIVSDIDLPGAPEYAFTVGDNRPAAGDWKAGAWLGASRSNGAMYRRTARTPLIGADPDLTPGSWLVWVRITDSPEVPVGQFDTIVIR